MLNGLVWGLLQVIIGQHLLLPFLGVFGFKEETHLCHIFKKGGIHWVSYGTSGQEMQ